MSDALLAGLFGVVTALATWMLAGYREKQSFKRDNRRERIKKLEGVYVGSIELLEAAIRITTSLGDFQDIERDLARNNALLQLFSTKQINEQMEKISELMERWSSLYRQGAPKRVGDTDMAIVSSLDSKYSRSAEELRPQLNDAILVVIDMMAAHIKSI